MKTATEEWTCPRCGLIGDHHRTTDPGRCRQCCTIDAAEDLLLACEKMLLVRSYGMEVPKGYQKARERMASAVRKAYGE